MTVTTSTGATTSSGAALLVTPAWLAVTVVFPAPTPVASPPAATSATAGKALTQVATAVRSWVLRSS